MGDGEKRRVRSGEVKRAEFAAGAKQVPVQCRGIAALAMYVDTVDGMKWRCNRCGRRMNVVHDVPAWFDKRAPEIAYEEIRGFMTLAQLMSDDAVH